ncbi:ABC-type multidrug transport system, ATPase and permease component [Amycolatopsis arida]|uniref:ABC-type multidrug transport system, ATPase and permease component n=1 Tax=Amycolatopsis arida TaxID=587909 RepID=A0A1I5YF15_9PSEU|nr:ABC transporter ATP-binding protein [Amycolatopsis arida]TDX90469.1 ABC-type multidrug transport system fused ATPase/permease subunit [Amycolatopsis arida]SFQ42811.1 ABC-type multidrug transport system, ATPase and permease component [Amycolatopsis arida]
MRTVPVDPRSTWRIARRHRNPLLVGVVLGMLGAAAALGQPLAIGELIRAAAGNTSLAWPVLLMVGLFCADAGLSAAQAYLIGRAGEGIVFDVRRSLVGRLLRADLGEFGRHQQGDVFTRAVTDTSMVKVALSHSLAQLVINGFMVAGGVVLMFLIDAWLMVLTLACLGVASGVSLWLARRLRKVAVQNRDDTGEFGADLQRALSALPTVKAARAEGREQRRIVELAERARRSGVRVGALSAMLTPTMNVGLQVSLAAVVGVGMTRAATGAMPIADLTAFVMYLFYLVSPLVLVFLSIGQFQQGRAAVQRVDELAEIPVEEPERPVPVSNVDSSAPAVEFRDVHFGYGAEEVLSGVSFDVPARGLTAVVGPSGAGKTTLFQLVERFYRPVSGQVLVGGDDVAELPLDVLRGRVGYVQQDSVALRGTLRENLVYANPSAGEADIRQALELAGLADLVAELPRGLETPLGEQGSGLSGGQRQRLCIARALLQRPAVLLLDEATSNLDSDAEAAFRQTLRRVSAHCAVVAIAHRMSTVVDAERIVVLSDGRVRHVGTHEDLLERDELYRRWAGSTRDRGVGTDGSERAAREPALVMSRPG